MNTTPIVDRLSLPDRSRRTFHVDVTLNGDSHRAYTVHTVDPLRAEQVLRTRFQRDDNVRTFSFDMVREVRDAWVPDQYLSAFYVTVPHWYEHRV